MDRNDYHDNAMNKTEKTNNARMTFLSKLSHEMRTPLDAVIGFSQLSLEDENIPAATRENLEHIHASGRTLLSLVNNLLDLAKINAGKYELSPEKYSVAAMISDCATFNNMQTAKRPIEFKLNVDERIPKYLIGDELRVKGIFNNLLSNAFKYTNEGTIEWSISMERSGDDIWIFSSVRDTGVGMHTEDVAEIFTDLSSFENLNNREVGGVGLGLSIAKKFIELMDGDIEISSEYGKGSTFSVKFRQGDAGSQPIGAETAKQLSGMRYHIASVSDHHHSTDSDTCKWAGEGSSETEAWKWINGVSYEDGLRRYGGNKELYIAVLEAFVQEAPMLIAELKDMVAEWIAKALKISEINGERMNEYRIAVHGLKSSLRNIAAAELGDEAEALELAAKADDLKFIREHHKSFLQGVNNLSLWIQKAYLDDKTSKEEKQVSKNPDRKILKALHSASQVFDIDGVETALNELESYEYEEETDNMLVEYLRNQATIMGFREIAATLRLIHEVKHQTYFQEERKTA
jgi:HPt (histidine-containing phosphotransfer) domain-containing protein/anti-sigma regulatory factor (Ser/Thr protein kinase)